MIIEEYKALNSSEKFTTYVDISCDLCKNIVIKEKRHLHETTEGKHWCSRICRSILLGTRLNLICDHCNKQFTRVRNKLKNSKSGKYFCCRKCKDIAQSYMKEIQPNHYKLEFLLIELKPLIVCQTNAIVAIIINKKLL